jgi:hypothetical protein
MFLFTLNAVLAFILRQKTSGCSLMGANSLSGKTYPLMVISELSVHRRDNRIGHKTNDGATYNGTGNKQDQVGHFQSEHYFSLNFIFLSTGIFNDRL